MSHIKTPTIRWYYQYIEGGIEIFWSKEVINTIPDEHDRWAIQGSIIVKTTAMPEYKWVGETVAVTICWIGYIRSNQTGEKMEIKVTGDKFKCIFPSIIKSLSEKTKFEIESGGSTCFCSWDRLKPFLSQAVSLRSGERILGIMADDTGISVRIGAVEEPEVKPYKPKRKK